MTTGAEYQALKKTPALTLSAAGCVRQGTGVREDWLLSCPLARWMHTAWDRK